MLMMTHLAYMYCKISLGILNTVIRKEPQATDPRWYEHNVPIDEQTGDALASFPLIKEKSGSYSKWYNLIGIIF